MTATDPASTVSTAAPGSGHPDGQTAPGGRSDPHGRSDQGGPHSAAPRRRGGGGSPPGLAPLAAAAARAAVRAPWTTRARRELLFCLAGLPFAVANPLVVFFLVVDLIWLVTPHRPPNPSWPYVAAAILVTGLLLALLVATGGARELGSLQRRLAERLLGARIAAPPPARRRPGRPGRLGRPGVGLRDGAGWRAAAYLALKLPVALLGLYAVFFWVGGLVNLSYPFWWGAFRNHPPGVRLSPVPVFTPFGWFGQGTFRVATLPGTFAAAGAGVAMLLAAPWVTRAVASADGWLIRGLLGPGRLAQRVHDLEQSRALAVDDSAAMLRRLERNLHDGAQIRLATLAMNLGMAKEKLGDAGEVADADAVRELVDAALRGAKDALGELRGLARGIHPPVLDHGLADALATLAADSAIPAELEVSIPVRPSPAIETIAYFCAAELLANAAKHSFASKIDIRATGRENVLLLRVTDDGTGGADPSRGSGLSGLAHRVAVVDGSLTIASPADGPTQITVELPLQA
jgi:signal transduction histidine kinase